MMRLALCTSLVVDLEPNSISSAAAFAAFAAYAAYTTDDNADEDNLDLNLRRE